MVSVATAEPFSVITWISTEASVLGATSPIIGQRYLAVGRARQGTVGEAPSILCPMRDLVDFAVSYFDAVL